METTAGHAVIEVLKSWNVKRIYGIPGSSVNGLMKALSDNRGSFDYIQVHHEAAGAMAAAAQSKFSSQIGVCFGSAAPGGTNLMNGLYDAKMDRVPLLAIVGQTGTANMNTTFFQEMDEIPVYADVSVYNRSATNAATIPHMLEEAIRTAYARRGVAVVILPNDLVETVIEYVPAAEKKTPPAIARPPIAEDDVDAVLEMIHKAKYPVLYCGLGLRGARDTVVEMSERFSMPIVTSASSIGVAAPNNHKNFMGSFGRLGTKPAYDVLTQADLILFAGSNFPFARYWPGGKKIVQINLDMADIGKQVSVDMGIVADAGSFFTRLLEAGVSRPEDSFLKAARISKQSWDKWLAEVAADDSEGLSGEAVLQAVRQNAAEDAFFGLDVGNNTIYSVRLLPLYARQQHIMSGWFATLGVALPYGTAAKLDAPERQVWTISGDGGFALNMQEIVTQARYKLPVINLVLSDESYGFIEHAQILGSFDYGVKIPATDWATAARGMGAEAFTVRTLEELQEAMEQINRLQAAGNKKPILLDAKLRYRDPMDTSHVILDPERFSVQEIEEYKRTYHVWSLPSFSEILNML